MEDTYRIKAIILNRRAFREHDLSVTVYSAEAGKQTLVARGAKKFRSKSAAHLEPFCLSEIMVVRGRQYDYVGSVIAEQCFLHLKNNLEKISAGGQALQVFNQFIKEAVPDVQLFKLLVSFLITLNETDLRIEPRLLASYFEVKLLDLLGLKPEIYQCSGCGQPIKPGNNRFDYAKGGLVCPACGAGSELTLTDNCIKVLRAAIKEDFSKLRKIKLNDILINEFNQLTQTLVNYQG